MLNLLIRFSALSSFSLPTFTMTRSTGPCLPWPILTLGSKYRISFCFGEPRSWSLVSSASLVCCLSLPCLPPDTEVCGSLVSKDLNSFVVSTFKRPY